MRVLRYAPSMGAVWDAFVESSRNGTFLFKRSYMDYHGDRFPDHSLLLWNDRGELVAILPATQVDRHFTSHAGLTYGGFVVGARMGTSAMLSAFEATLTYLRAQEMTKFSYKTVPHIYHSHPAEEDRYALFRFNARLVRRDVLAVAVPPARLPYQERRARKMRQALKNGVTVGETTGFGAFWPILDENLSAVHHTRPVHSLAEITMLRDRFPENIRLHMAWDDGQPLGGAVIYDTGRVAHVQYIASNARGREIGALDLLFASLIETTYAERAFFDFGISNEQPGSILNVGLIEQKEGFGARAVAHDHCEVPLS